MLDAALEVGPAEEGGTELLAPPAEFGSPPASKAPTTSPNAPETAPTTPPAVPVAVDGTVLAASPTVPSGPGRVTTEESARATSSAEAWRADKSRELML